ncbi:MAG: AbrB/MazE/SpoVT family DNA-binding domain-containing protein [Eubacterium sp.]
MKIYGIKRQVDDLGRIAIPKEIRQDLEIKEGQQMEIVAINGVVIIGKVKDGDTE